MWRKEANYSYIEAIPCCKKISSLFILPTPFPSAPLLLPTAVAFVGVAAVAAAVTASQAATATVAVAVTSCRNALEYVAARPPLPFLPLPSPAAVAVEYAKCRRARIFTL